MDEPHGRRAAGPRMVGWYDPGQLVRTAQQVVLSTIFGRHADHRLIEALASCPEVVFDYTRPIRLNPDGDPRRDEATERFVHEDSPPRDEIWIDYAADVGDGWNSTYAVAFHLTHPSPGLAARDGRALPRGDILVFGGDEVYPTPSREEYETRLIAPYSTALYESSRPAHVYAIPGNHDWYDSLVSFTRVFISKAWLGGWFAPQTRSYFALKLPHRWWLLGVDVQLGSDIDGPQVKYFRKIASEMQDGDHVILCLAEPHWIYEKLYHDYDDEFSQSNLAYLEKRILSRAKVMVFLAGDLHHYRRHESPDGAHKITAGGGGGFTHPTHTGRLRSRDVNHLPDAQLEPIAGEEAVKPGQFSRLGFELKAVYPSVEDSRRHCLWNLAFPFLNPWFGLVTGSLYLLICWAVRAPLVRHPLALEEIGPAFRDTMKAVVASPPGTVWVLATLLGFVLFTDVAWPLYRWVGGLVHGSLHLVAVFLVGWVTAVTCQVADPLQDTGPASLLAAVLMVMALGWVVGSFVLGCYLYASLNWLGVHVNEAFSSLRTQDWKCFLKLHIDRAGDLTVYPIGIDRVPRRWKSARDPDADGGPGTEGGRSDTARVLPDDDDPRGRPRLIEPAPIVVRGPGRAEHRTSAPASRGPIASQS